MAAGDRGSLEAEGRDRRRAFRFLLLTAALAIPFWLFGAEPLPGPIRLPVSALAFVCPLLAASILTFIERGRKAVKVLLRRVVDVRTRGLGWYVPVLLLMPAVYLVSYVVMRLMERPLPDPDVPLASIPILLAIFFIAAVGEEAGYTGYAADLLQRRWPALGTALALGFMWGLLHVVPDIQNGHGLSWIVWQRAVYSVSIRVLIVWIYNSTRRSLFAAVLFHDVENVSWSLFPNGGSHYDPMVTGVITAIVASVVTFIWGPRSLSGRGPGRPGRRDGADGRREPQDLEASARIPRDALDTEEPRT